MIAADPHSVEWLETNGAGSYALSTVCGRNDRRYHGLLVAALKPPVARHVLLSKIDEEVEVGVKHELATNAYRDVIHPQGFRWIASSARDPFPRITWRVPGAVLEKTVAMIRGERSVAVRYRLIEGAHARLVVRPLTAFRPDHQLSRSRPGFDKPIEWAPGRATIRPVAELPELHFNYSDGEILPGHSWYFNFKYETEKARGLDFVEDLHNPFAVAFELEAGRDAWVVASLDRTKLDGVPALVSQESERRRTLAVFKDRSLDLLALAGDAFW